MKNPVISKFKETPKTETAWWAMGLGLGTLAIGPMLGTSAAVLRPFLDRFFGEPVGIAAGVAVAILALALTVSALVTSIRAFKMGERSWVIWFGLIPSIMAAAFWAMLVVGEFAFPH